MIISHFYSQTGLILKYFYYLGHIPGLLKKLPRPLKTGPS